ncbi:MAG: superoxide dismutase [Ferruginibacter sp.]
MENENTYDRRRFLSSAAKGILFASVVSGGASQLLASCSTARKATTKNIIFTGFDQQPLPYSYSALEDVIDAMTMEIHYTKHAAGYSKNLKEAVASENVNSGTSVEEILGKVSKYSTKMRNNAGGHYNHELFWKSMRAKRINNKPAGNLATAIDANFSSFEGFKLQFATAAGSRFGSGWAWLYIDNNKNLKIGSTPNQDNPLMDVSDVKGLPVFGLDVWEHAYYLKYQNKRADYIANWWNIANWEFIENRYDQLLKM